MKILIVLIIVFALIRYYRKYMKRKNSQSGKLTKPYDYINLPETDDYEKNYSHTHCWEQDTEIPACGIAKYKHGICCLCGDFNTNYPELKDYIGGVNLK